MPDVLDALLAQVDRELAARRRRPRATYRLQLHAGFTFRDAQRLVPYLYDLGISHSYSSPYLKARRGSQHGYDITCHATLNPEIGTEDDYAAWVSTLQEYGIEQVLDWVPNHMGIVGNENAWWNEVLERGPASPYAGFFDIAWYASPRPELQGKLLLPILGEPYGQVLESRQIRLDYAAGAFSFHYYEHRLPVAPRGYAKILGHRLAELTAALGGESPALIEYQSILTAIKHLPAHTETQPAKVAEGQREKEVVKRRLAGLTEESPAVYESIQETLALYNGAPGDPRSFDLLDGLLDEQAYRLAYWRVAADEINYRRFFDINDLAALNMERPEVFAATHELLLGLLSEGKIHGLRIDHIDGLYDPKQYLQRLQREFVLAVARRVFNTNPEFSGLEWGEVEQAVGGRPWPAARGTGEQRNGGAEERTQYSVLSTQYSVLSTQHSVLGTDSPSSSSSLLSCPPDSRPATPPLYVVVEKILGANEPLPDDWPVCGTSGYGFLNMLNGLFVDTSHAQAFTRTYQEWVQDDTSFNELVYQKKYLILQTALSSELHMLAHQLDRLAQKSRWSRDFTFHGLHHALREILACFPVYRSYINGQGVHETDAKYVQAAVKRAKNKNPALSAALFDFVRDLLLLNYSESANAADRAEQRRFVGKFQQVTSPVMAKGLEDTACYVYNRLLSLNEVGGDPARFGLAPGVLHRYLQERQARWPCAFSASSTHDTKRSEDVRARLNVLSELPQEWQEGLVRWHELNLPHRTELDDAAVPDANEEYHFYQTLLGAWPLEPYTAAEYADFVTRVQAYMHKALHEAKVHASWINPNPAYDEALKQFVARALDPQLSGPFLEDLRAFQRRVSHFGLLNSLSQVVLKAAAPGVPDFYQGCELWDFSLVDPDNRRPVDFARRREMLHELQTRAAAGPNRRELARELALRKEDGRVKLYVTYQALHCRRTYPNLFTTGDYFPLEVQGARQDHGFGFARREGDVWALVLVPRLLTRLVSGVEDLPCGEDVWQDTEIVLPEGCSDRRWRNLFTGEALRVTKEAGQRSLFAADVFGCFPVAWLMSEES